MAWIDYSDLGDGWCRRIKGEWGRLEGSGLTSEACEFVRSKPLLNHTDSRFWDCGFAVDNFVLVELRARRFARRVLLLGVRK